MNKIPILEVELQNCFIKFAIRRLPEAHIDLTQASVDRQLGKMQVHHAQNPDSLKSSLYHHPLRSLFAVSFHLILSSIVIYMITMFQFQIFRPLVSAILLLLFANPVCSASPPSLNHQSTSLSERTRPSRPICPPGGTYGRPNWDSCRDAWAIVQPHGWDQTFIIPNLNDHDEIISAHAANPPRFEFINPGSIRSHPELEVSWTPMRFPASRCVISVSMKDGANENSDVASNDDILNTAWWIIEQCVSTRGIGGYDFTGNST